MKTDPTVSIAWPVQGLPSGLYRRLLVTRRSGLPAGGVLPRIACAGQSVRVPEEQLAGYRGVVGYPSHESEVPLLYPHALLGHAHLVMLSHQRFPLSSFGLLHLRNHVIQYGPLAAGSPWNVECVLARQRSVERGLEFDFDSTVTVDGQRVWSSVSTFLKRGSAYAGTADSPGAQLFSSLREEDKQTRFDVPKDIGRRYAKVTGDYNPIHVSHLAAKLFGFKRAIAHGMWTAARAIRELTYGDYPIRFDVAFKGPMFVGSSATMQFGEDNRFDIHCDRNPRPVVVGVHRSGIDPSESFFPSGNS